MKSKHSNIPTFQRSRGVSLYLAVMIMSVLLALALGISTISLGQLKTVKEMASSVYSFYAAETGIERELFEKNVPPFSYSGYLGEATFEVQVIASGQGDCPLGISHCIKSIGSYKSARRAIQATR